MRASSDGVQVHSRNTWLGEIDDLKASEGLFAVLPVDVLFRPVGPITQQRQTDFSAARVQVPGDFRDVSLDDLFVLQHLSQPYLGGVIEREHHKAGSRHIQPVYHSGVWEGRKHAVMQVVGLFQAGHAQQAGGFVNDQHVVVLIHNGEAHEIDAGQWIQN